MKPEFQVSLHARPIRTLILIERAMGHGFTPPGHYMMISCLPNLEYNDMDRYDGSLLNWEPAWM